MKINFSQKNTLPDKFTFETSWKSPSNIALVKYWGKTGIQHPLNPSVSMTLKHAYSTIHLSAKKASVRKVHFTFNNQPNDAFVPKIEKALSLMEQYLPYLKTTELHINSTNAFPHSAGIASSASSMSALALALAELDDMYTNHTNKDLFNRKASFLSRLASGSAARSVFPGYSLWGQTELTDESSDDYAIEINKNIHPAFQTVQDTILVVNASPKAVSSSTGHRLMVNHPFRDSRIEQALNHTKELFASLQNGDWEAFIELTEREALSLHGLMLSSQQSFILMKPETLAIIEKIRKFRKQTALPLCFTLDAGPNVHVLYPKEQSGRISKFINDELAIYCENGYQLKDEIGPGPEKLNP